MVDTPHPGKTQGLHSKSTLSAGPYSEVLGKSFASWVEFVNGERGQQGFGQHLLTNYSQCVAEFSLYLPSLQGKKRKK